MKVCIVSDDLPPDCGGAPLIALRLAERLQTAEGIQTTMIAWDRSGNQSNHESLPAYVRPVKLHFQDDGRNQTPLGLVKMSLSIVELGARLGALLFTLRREFDILHISNAASLFSLVTVPLAKLLKKPVVIEMVLLGSDDPLKLNERSMHPEQQIFPHRPLKYSLFLQADAYVSISPALSEAYRQAGLTDAKLFEIPYGVDVKKFKPPTPQEKRVLRYQLGLDEEQVIILFVGVINERKGVRRLLAAFREVASSHSEAQLLVLGPSLLPDADYLQSVRKSIDAWDLSGRVMLVDELVDNVHDYMRAADIFCLPTRREGFGMVIIEAMAAGLPVVVSRLEGVTTEIIRSDREGILVPVGDTARLAEALTELIGDNMLRSKLGQAARRKVLSEYVLETYSRRWLSLYNRIIDEASAPD